MTRIPAHGTRTRRRGKSAEALLSAEEEVILAKRIEAGLLARERLDAGDVRDPLLRAELEWLAEDGWLARDRFITANMRYVHFLAARYRDRGLDLEDLVQEGMVGLIRTVEKFDYTKGFKFSTYAMWWIRQAITRALANDSRTIRVPVHMVEVMNKLADSRRKLREDLGRDPTPQELADQLGMDPQRVRVLRLLSRRPMSLEEPFPVRPGEADHRSEQIDGVWCSPFGDLIQELEPPLTDEADGAEVWHYVQLLPPKEAQVLRLRFGLDGELERTLAAVGELLGLTRERVRQVESRAISRLQSLERPARPRSGQGVSPR